MSQTATEPNADDVVAAGRTRIDELDRHLVALLQERVEVSRRIQQARVAAGGRRVEHSRELQVMERYAEALGRDGASLALAVLELCRGRR